MQVNYILGENPLNMSYMVGYGSCFPQRIHHRASSLPSVVDHPDNIACKSRTCYYKSNDANTNLLMGAVVGGPNEYDQFPDDRTNFREYHIYGPKKPLKILKTIVEKLNIRIQMRVHQCIVLIIQCLILFWLGSCNTLRFYLECI